MPYLQEHRRHPRRAFVRRGTVEIPVGGGSETISVPGTFESLSCGGAGLSLDGAIPVELDPGSSVELCLYSSGRGLRSRATRLPARVAWSQRREGRLRVGAELVLDALTSAQTDVMHRLMNDQPLEPPADTGAERDPGDDAASAPALMAEAER